MPKPKKEGGRNGNGMGTVRERNGRWEYRFSVRDEDGASRQVSTYGATQKEAVDKGRKLEEAHRKGLVAKKDARTFKAFSDEWLERKERSGKAQNTVRGYRQDLALALPLLGELRLQAIKPAHVRKLLDNLAKHEYSARTQRHVLQTVKAIFAQAMRLELIYKNPAEFVELEAPPSESKAQSLQPEEVQTLLGAVKDSPMGLLFRLLLGCGLRKGEALALTWGDVDLKRAELSISKNWTGQGNGHMSRPKTRSSRRVVPIPTGLLARLEAEYRGLLKDWKPAELAGLYLFGTDKPFNTQSPNHALKRIVEGINKARREAAKEAGTDPVPFPQVRVHDLRHTYGSIALSRGIPLEVVSERMGHANPTITLNVYRHVLEHERRAHVFDLEELIQPPAPQVPTVRAQA